MTQTKIESVIGRTARWTSHTGKSISTKQGKIVAVIEKGQYLKDVIRFLKIDLRKYNQMFEDTELKARYKRYLVEVPQERGKPKLYYPIKAGLVG